MPNKFNIENFEAKHLKKADAWLSQNLQEVEKLQSSNKIYRKAFSSKSTLWDKIKKSLHRH